jgi:ribonucleoside-diphosphate reductase alpha chain
MAMAPEHVGIGIRRYFTREGAHPYDSVEWERRDARITNYKDGTDAFFQPEVEFPTSWSLNATNIVAQKYFRGTLGTAEREFSLRQVIDRVADTITDWGVRDGYFTDDAEAEAFRSELKFVLVTQRAAFNSPVWFNIGVKNTPQQASACFILAVEDTMDGILNWYREEGTIFKGGSGSGINLSNIRSSVEGLKGGGTASGPVSFMRGADASAGTIKSGGKTRRAAKMVILNADHPDVEEFIWCKATEERKARALAAAGFDMDLDGKDSHSIQYQNANNSVRVTDDFMRAVVDDRDWDLKEVTTGDTHRTVKARELMRQISDAAWQCADPGMQFDTTINRWHTAPNSGRINASNPCFTGDTFVHTDKGLVRFAQLLDRVRNGETFGVYTHDATNPDAPAERLEVTRPEAVMVTGFNEIVKLRFSNGMELRCTPGHRIFTMNRGYVEAENLTADDRVKLLTLAAPATSSDWRIPRTAIAFALAGKGDRASRSFDLPEKWSAELGHYLGWLVGDGCISGDVVTTVYGGADEQAEILPRHRALAAAMNGGQESEPSAQSNGTVQLRQSRRVIARFLHALGVSRDRAAGKIVPESIYGAPTEVVSAFLRGLFDADGCVYDGDKSRYVGLGSASRDLLVGVQRLLTTFGVSSRVYESRGPNTSSFSHTRSDGTEVHYDSDAMFDLRISGPSVATFAAEIGFELPRKSDKLDALVEHHRFYATDDAATLVERVDDGVELTFNLSEPRNHSYIANGIVVRNCSEYMHLDNSACNLASINLLKYLDADGRFDVEAYKHTVEVMFTAQEILVGNADYPTAPIGENSRKFRQLGLGYANLGALLMAEGLPYDSPAGRAWAASLTALMTGHAYATSARTAGRMGPFAGYAENADAMLNVLRMHRAEAANIDEELVPPELLSAAQQSWDEAVELGEQYGVRNAQATVLAPTGCLVGGTLVPTERGLVRLRSLGDPDGAQWQDLGVTVLTDDGEREATKFHVNGLEQVVDVVTRRGYSLRGTTKHRIKVVDDTGAWVWRRFADLRAGDRVPLALGRLVGAPQQVALPPLGEGHWTEEHSVRAPSRMSAELAEFVGYFMGDGSLHARGIRLCVASDDFEVAEHLAGLGKELFGLEAHRAERTGYTELSFHSVRLAQWWEAAGFAKHRPNEEHAGKGWTPHIPNAVLHANCRETYAAFVRGLFEADATVTAGIPTWTTASTSFADDVQTLLLSLGFPTTRSHGVSGRGSNLALLRLLNTAYHDRFLADVGFLSARKTAKVVRSEGRQAARQDHIPVTRAMVDRLAPVGHPRRSTLQMEIARGRVSRRLATELFAATGDEELGHLLDFFYDTIASAELGDEELTYDLSVPENVTYVANGFVSHNTIGLMMDCDTTGIEPDLALTKAKKLVGGGTMFIVNQTIPRALRKLAYTEGQIEGIINHIDEHKSIMGAPGFKPEHLPVFACSMGDNTIHYMGHVTMMGAVQPFISGAISKCVTGETLIATADGLVRIGTLHRGEASDSFRDEVIEVASLTGPQKTDAFYFGGLRPVREVVLRSGHRVVATPNHRLLVASPTGFDWTPTEDIVPGDYVATQYGDDMWSAIPARLDGFRPSAPYGSQKAVRLPHEMTAELAFLLGAYAAEGHTTRANWTVTITNSVDAVLERVAAAWRSELGLDARIIRPADRCASVVVASKTVVELLEHLGCGARASEKRIPDAVLRSPREMVLAFLQGLALDAYVTTSTAPKWAICLDSPALLDDLQAVLTNLGVVHSRVAKYDREYDKTFGEVYATGTDAQTLVSLVPFLEPTKQQRAEELCVRSIDPRRDTADVVPGIRPRDLYELLPQGRSGRAGAGTGVANEFRFLCDERTRHVTRRALERVAAVPGVVLPTWLRTVLDDNLHFSPVESVDEVGLREVFDISVPTTHAFVGNGIVNHNTVNMPEEATVEDVEQLHVEAWRLGLKAVAIYRDNCKVGQPLSTQKKEGASAPVALEGGEIVEATPERIVERVIEHVIVQEPVRQKLPRVRTSKTFSFRVADCHGYATVGEFEDGRPGELFLKVAKQGSTLSGIMDTFAIALSLGLQYGVPLKAFVEKFVNTRFEPAGMTDDPELRIATSLVDYIFRRLAVVYMDEDERRDMGILTVSERIQPTLPGVEEAVEAQATQPVLPPEDRAPSADAAPTLELSAPPAAPSAPVARESEHVLCYVCGDIMQRAGSCHACPSCGATSGCS